MFDQNSYGAYAVNSHEIPAFTGMMGKKSPEYSLLHISGEEFLMRIEEYHVQVNEVFSEFPHYEDNSSKSDFFELARSWADSDAYILSARAENGANVGTCVTLPISHKLDICDLLKGHIIDLNDCCYVCGIWTMPQARGNGLAKMLLQNVVDVFGHNQMIARINVENLASQHVFNHCEFSEIQGVRQVCSTKRLPGYPKDDLRLFVQRKAKCT